MSKVWPEVTKDKPCPVCQKPDYCVVGDILICCMRIQSDRPAKNGGWYHKIEGAKAIRQSLPKRQEVIVPKPYFQTLISKLVNRTTPGQVCALAANLDVSMQSLLDIDACWHPESNAWAFPMRNENREIVGVRIRSLGGAKWALTGSRQGLFIPRFVSKEILFVVEGPTNLAACISAGINAVGRASCNTCGEILKKFMALNNLYKAVIVVDNDNKVSPTGEHYDPGAMGAKRLAKELGCAHTFFTPPTKDIRDYIKLGATKQVIHQAILKNIVWFR